ncbi:hypothetical protein [Streptomyces sp. SLBN-134]|uniref:hypothetical protein n=1 Tax=Streptomyces sp. SLBN-134 TaxID=2768456 RepID=UPI001C92E19A|nr:hypothetical protein [Streptomyces sp. SLBN-134]
MPPQCCAHRSHHGDRRRVRRTAPAARRTSWLRRHAPATHARHERRIGRPLHDDLKALWELNEGAYLFGFPGFLDGCAPLSIDGSFLCHPLERAGEWGWEPARVPFACDDPADPYPRGRPHVRARTSPPAPPRPRARPV